MKVNRWLEAREKEGDNKEVVGKAVKALYLKVKQIPCLGSMHAGRSRRW